jgi:hypothetical protein
VRLRLRPRLRHAIRKVLLDTMSSSLVLGL